MPKPANRRVPAADIFKFAGLIGFFVVCGIIIAALWPHISVVFEEGGLEGIIEKVREAGASGVLILEAAQFLQIVVAFIPGEVTQMAAGAIYGPWLGALLILIGCVISSAAVYGLVHWLGAPFVRDMVPQKHIAKFRKFEESGKFNIVVFVLFLIPGMPKDIFTYITPLSDMRLGTFLALTNIARIPGIVLSTYAASGLLEGRIIESIIIFAVLAAIAIAAVASYNKIINTLHALTTK